MVMRMTRSFLRIAALLILCALLVYAPEILTAVSAPYKTDVPRRILLRVALCTQDSEASASFYKALSGYQKLYPAVHLRVVRADAQQLFALGEPRPDVYCFSSSLESIPGQALIPLSAPEGESQTDICFFYAYRGELGETLYCGVSSGAREAAAALELIGYLHSVCVSRPQPGEI